MNDDGLIRGKGLDSLLLQSSQPLLCILNFREVETTSASSGIPHSQQNFTVSGFLV